MINVENIIALEYVNDVAEKFPIRIINLNSAIKKYKEFNINLDKETWEYNGYKNVKIGDMRSINFNNDTSFRGIVGVYDKTNMAHLNNEAKHISSITKNIP